jgi:D-glycero-D-manno-heptose 1,7-bisphosphate phosphatase
VSRRAVFLDRDGVLNEVTTDERGVPHPPESADAVRICDDAAAACRALREAGYLLIVVTNQPDVARGTQRREVVGAINALVEQRLELDGVMCCYHDDSDGCSCRKPKPGLLRAAAEKWDIDLGSSFVVGDRWKDIAAGAEAGCWTALVVRGYSGAELAKPDYSGVSFGDATRWILGRGQGYAATT